MASLDKIKLLGLWLALVVFWSVAAPLCRAATIPPGISSRSFGPGIKILPGQHGPEGMIRKAAVAHHRPAMVHRSKRAGKNRGGVNNYGLARGPFLSRIEVKEVLARAGFPTEVIPAMLRIANCESSLSATAENVNRDGSVDVGLFQINERNWEGCNASKADLADPEDNARCAYQIWQRQGYDAWACCDRA